MNPPRPAAAFLPAWPSTRATAIQGRALNEAWLRENIAPQVQALTRQLL